MKKSLITPLMVILVAAAIGGMAFYSGGGKQEAPTSEAEQAGLRQANLEIGGLFCIGCSGAVEGAVSQMPGVEAVTIGTKDGLNTVVYDPALTSAEAILANPIFQTYPASLLSDQSYEGSKAVESSGQQLPVSLEDKLSEASLLLQQKEAAGEDFGVYEDAYAQLDQYIQKGQYSSAEFILDSLLLQLSSE